MHAKKVLVADEKANSRELLRIILEHEGCEVSEASDGREAVTLARKTLPDLIFIDLQLPGLDAFAAVREMRRDSRLKSRSIIAMTDSTRNVEDDHLNEAGFTTYIAKPVVLKSLSEHLAELSVHHAH